MKHLLFLWIGFTSAAIPLYAHHSFIAVFDRTKPVNVTGTITKVEWTNPHIWF